MEEIRQSEGSFHMMGETAQEANQAVMPKGNMKNPKSMTDQEHSGIGADNSSLSWRKAQFQEKKS